MTNTHITVVYKWTAKPGKLEELKSIYEQVLEAMKQNEPDAQAAHCYVSEKDNALHVRDEFKDAAALGLHLSSTAPRPVISHSCLPSQSLDLSSSTETSPRS